MTESGSTPECKPTRRNDPALHWHEPTRTLAISNLPPFAFGSRKKEWLESFLAQPLEHAAALIVDVPTGAPEDGLRTTLDAAAARGVPVRFVGFRREGVAAAYVDTPEEALEAFRHFPRAGIDARDEPPGIVVARWQGDLATGTLGIVVGLALDSPGRSALVLSLDRRAGGVTHYDPAVARRLAQVLDESWPGRARLFDMIGGADKPHGEEWPRYFPEVFPPSVSVASTKGGAELQVREVFTSAEVASYLAAGAPGRYHSLRVEPGTFVTPQAMEALDGYLARRGGEGHPPLVLRGLPATDRRVAVWFSKGYVDLAPAEDAASARPAAHVPEAKYDVFVSHKGDDLPLARRVHEFLTARGLKVFLDRIALPELGEADFGKAINEAIDRSNHMVVVASSPVNAGERWVEHEWSLFMKEKLAGRKRGNILTVIETGDIASLPIPLRGSEVVDASSEGLQRLVSYLWTRPPE